MSAREAWLEGRQIASASAWIAAFAFVAVAPVAIAAAQPGETGQVVFSRGGDVWSMGPGGTGEVQLTSGPANDRWPRWSPEGNRIAVVRDGELVLLRATGALLRILTTHGDVVGSPSWSPDGMRLVYARGSGGIAVVEATEAASDGTLLAVGPVTSVAWNPIHPDQIAYTDGGAVFTVRPDGSGAAELLPPDVAGRTRDELVWDSQSGQVVFTSSGPDGTRIEEAGVSLDNASGADRAPAWSADGQEMFFSRGGVLHTHRRAGFPFGANVRSLGVAGDMPDAQPTLISSAAAYESDLGTQLVFRVWPLAGAPMVVDYQTVAGTGSATEYVDYWPAAGTVTTPDAFGRPGTASIFLLGDTNPEPDETFFVDFTFPSDPAAPLRVRGTILNDDGGRSGVITHTSSTAAGSAVFAFDPVRGTSEMLVPSAGSAVFSPGGDRLAYLRQNAGLVELVVADPDGVPQVTFPVGGSIDTEIVWSPDGLRLAWTEAATLRVAEPWNASSARSIATDAVGPSWSADAGPGPRRLVFARPSTGRVCTILEDGSSESCLIVGYQPQWSPDGTTIAFLRHNVSVFLANPDGTNERFVASVLAGGGPLLRWSPRGGAFAVMTSSALLIAQEGSPATSVAGLPPALGAFDWSPDGNQLVVQGSSPAGEFQLWIVGPDDAGQPFARTRQVTTPALVTEAIEPRWSSVPAHPSARLVSRGGIERFRQVRVEMELSAPSPDPVTLTWETVGTGTATPGEDYTPVTGGTIVLQPGETSAPILIEVVDDTLAEGYEFFEVRLTAAAGARLGSDTQVQVFITDDDGSPVAVNDVAVTAIDTAVDIDVLANDHDLDGDPLTLVSLGTPAHGTATFAGGIVTYTPQDGFEGVDFFLYSVSDGNGHTAAAAVSVHVGDAPLPPPPGLTVTPAFLDFGQVPVNKTKDLVLTVTNNTAAPVELAEVFAINQGAPYPFDASDFEGCARVRTLDPGQSCTRTIRFWSVPGAGAASPASLQLLHGTTFVTLATVPLFASVGPPDTGPNSPPVPVDDLAGVAPGFTHMLDALRNDSDPDDDLLRIVAVSDPPHGTARVVPCALFPVSPNADCIEYVPDTEYLGLDVITYTVSDGRGGTASAVYHITVGNVVPHVDAITPASGPTSGGQAVRITGSNFVYRSDVAFVCGGSLQPLTVTRLTDEEILATTSPWPFPGLCDLQVRTLFAQVGRLPNAYRYDDAGSPATTTTITTSASPSRAGQAVTFTASVAATTGPTPQGSVRFDDTTTGASLGTVTLDAAGVARQETNALAVGPHAIVATYLPDAGSPYQGSSGSLTQVVEPASADLSIAATAAPDPVVAGSVLTYSPTVTNPGPDTAHAVRVSLEVPATVDFVGSSPAGWCTGPSAGTAGTIVCDLGDLPPGASNSILIETRPNVAGPLAATLTVSATETDPSSANNSANVSVVVRLDPVVLAIVENIVVTDAPELTPSVLLNVPEDIVVTDAPTLTPAVMLNVPEAIVVTDTLAVTPAVMLNVPETILVSDALSSSFPDATPPTVTIDQAAGQADPTGSAPIAFTVVFSEPVMGFDGSDLSFAGSTAAGSLAADVTGSGASYAVSVTGMSGTGTVVASIPAGAAVDAAGNPSAASTSTDGTVLYQVTLATTTTLTTSRTPSLTTAPPVLTATVSSAGPAVTGQVEFLRSGVVFGTSTVFERDGQFVAVLGGATLTVSGSPHTLTARYLGDGTYVASTSTPLEQTVRAGTYFMEDASGLPSTFVPVALDDGGRIAGNRGTAAGVYDPITGFRFLDPVSAFSEAFDMNTAGTVVGRRGPSPTGTTGFLDRAGVLDAIPSSVSAVSVNGREQIAIRIPGRRSSLYDGGAITALGLFDASGINDATTVVGAIEGSGGLRDAVVWQAGVLTNLGRFGEQSASASHVNNAGTVLVRTTDTSGRAFARLYRNGVDTPLGPGRPWDVNDADVVVAGTEEARVNVGGSWTLLANGPVTGMAINNRGEIVGSVSAQLKRWTPVPTSSLVVSPVTAFEDDDVTLTATLTSQGAPAAGHPIAFSLNGHFVGSATTGSNGVAVLDGASVGGIPIGVHPGGVRASFAGSPALGASTATALLTIEARNPADLRVSASTPTPSAPVGSNVTFNVSASNLGPSSAIVLRLNVTLPAGLQYLSDTGAGACSWLPGLGTCDFDNFAAGATRNLSIVARSLAAGPLTATFVVSAPQHDPNMTNNTAAVTVDAPPTVTINQAADQPDPTSTSPVRFTVAFSEPVTGFTGSDVSFAGSAVGGTLAATVTGSGANYTVAVTGMTGVGIVAVSIPAGAAVDSGGKPSTASTSSDRTVLYGVKLAYGFVQPSNGGNLVFSVVDLGGQPTGLLSYSKGNVSYTATRITSFVISGQTATIEGFSSNGRFFVATLRDGGPGQPDQFRLWIEGVEQTAGGAVSASSTLVIQPWAPDTRLKGWVDLHTHPMSNIAFGGKLFHGAPDVGSLLPAVQMPSDPVCRFDQRATSIAEALSQDGPTRGDPLQSRCGDAVRNTLIKAIESFNGATVAPASSDGFPAFTYWPKWSDITHQKMWIDWIRRARDGGLRVMVALSHNNRTLAELLGSGGPITGVKNDKASSDLQVEEIQKLVDDHPDFMAVATTPAELQNIVQGGRLAVVLGVEIDKIGNFGTNSGVTQLMVDNEIARLFAQGVRYVLPIHFTDNAFGDAALYESLYDIVNFRENGVFFKVGCAQQSDEVGFQVAGFPAVLNPFIPPGAPAPAARPSCLFQRQGVIQFDGHVNTRTANGLTSLGEYAIRAMMRRGMIVDVDHMSDRAANRTLALATAVPGGGYPVMSGHSGVRSRTSTLNAENSRTTAQLARIACLGGMFGLGTGEKNGTRAVDWTTQYARAYEVMRRAFGPSGVCPQGYPLGAGFIGLGTDANSLVKTPRAPLFDPVGPPRFTDIYNPGNPVNTGVPPLGRSTTGSKTWDYNSEGVAHYGMFVDFLRDVRTLPANATMTGRQIFDDQMTYAADYFHRMWLKADTQKARVP